MRLFVAIELDAAARDAVAAEQRRVGQSLGNEDRKALKWVNAAQVHLTLAFLGEIAEPRHELIAQAMCRPLPAACFDVAFGGLGVFPSHGAPRVLWVGITEGLKELIELQRLVVERLQRLDVVLEDRGFHPHLTLARWRSSRPSDRRRALAAAPASRIARIRVESVALFESRLSLAGATHVPICFARLGE
jgi:RNA 2',3'-cyclic 3'-phosphodiesterase